MFADGRADVQVQSLRRIGRDRLTEQVEVDAALAAFEVEIDAAGGRTASPRRRP